jgi:hypothetical protein
MFPLSWAINHFHHHQLYCNVSYLIKNKPLFGYTILLQYLPISVSYKRPPELAMGTSLLLFLSWTLSNQAISPPHHPIMENCAYPPPYHPMAISKCLLLNRIDCSPLILDCFWQYWVLVLAKQAHYHLSHSTSPFGIGYFWDSISNYAQLAWISVLLLCLTV